MDSKITAERDFVREMLRCPTCHEWENIIVASEATSFATIDILDDGKIQYAGESWHHDNIGGRSFFWCHKCDHEVDTGEKLKVEGVTIG